MDVGMEKAWECVHKLFKLFDRRQTGVLDLDQLVDFVAEVRKMDVVPVDEANIVRNLQEGSLDAISFAQFREWCHGPEGEQKDGSAPVTLDPFGNKSVVPARFENANNWTSNIKVQHPCFTTTAHEIGCKRPQQVDMPLKWRGKEGVFTKDFEMNEPGKSTITVNNYRNLGLRTCKTYSKVHRDLDMDF